MLTGLIETFCLQAPEMTAVDVRPLERASVSGEIEVRFLGMNRDIFRLVQEIMKALDRIDAGTYGICVLCRGAIQEHLLSETPWTPLCRGCEQTNAPRNGLYFLQD
jgi:RNA polymerase-binding transcription factor DksA